MPTTNSNGPEQEKQPYMGQRRHSDRALIKSLVGACAFLFVICVVAVTYIIATTKHVNHLTEGLRAVVCTQNAAYRAAYDRELALVKTGPASQAKAHRQSAATLKIYLDKINPLVECKPVIFKLPDDSTVTVKTAPDQ